MVSVVRQTSPAPLLAAEARAKVVRADVRSPADLLAVLVDAQPDYVFHLAAATPPARDEDYFSVNVGGTINLLEAVTATCPSARVLIVGSDAQYGRQHPRTLPTRESAPMRPVGAYGRSKVLAEAAALAHRRMTGARVICVRAFNHIGPGQSERFVVSSLARQVARAECNLGPSTVEMGCLESARDFTDVRDTVWAYILALLQGRPGGVYNIGTGTSRTMREITIWLAAAARRRVSFRSTPDRLRPDEVKETRCNASKLQHRTGWRPTIPFDQTLTETLEYWRRTVPVEASNG